MLMMSATNWILMFVFLAIVLLFMVYVVFLKPWFKNKGWFQGFYAWIEPIEKTLWSKSRTLFFSRLYSLLGSILLVQSTFEANGIDWVSLIPIPPEYSKYLGPVMLVTGLLFSKLRKDTTAPVAVVEERK